MPLKIGDDAPDFSFTDEAGRETSLKACLSAGPVVVYFYPADFTPVCTKEACMFRDMHSRLIEGGIRVIGVSPQSAESHERFKAKHGLGFALVADPTLEIAGRYRAKGIFGLPIPIGVRRVTYLVGTDGRIKDRATGEFGLAEHGRFLERISARGSVESGRGRSGAA